MNREGASEAGLIMVSQSGQVRFWQSISVAISGSWAFVAQDLGFTAGEEARGLEEISVRRMRQAGICSRFDSSLVAERVFRRRDFPQ